MDTSPVLAIFIFFIFITITTSYSQDLQYNECSLPFHCGAIRNVGYPFWGKGRPQFCGRQGCELECPDDQARNPLIKISSLQFQVLSIDNSEFLMRIRRADMSNICTLDNRVDTMLNDTLFVYLYASDTILVLLYNCNGNGDVNDMHDQNWNYFRFNCSGKNDNYFVEDGRLNGGRGVPSCTPALKVPILHSEFSRLIAGEVGLQEAVDQGFLVHYRKLQEECKECQESGGICGSDGNMLQNFSCLCPDGPRPQECPRKRDTKWKLLTAVGISSGLGGMATICIVSLFYFRHNRRKYTPFFMFFRHNSLEVSKSDTRRETYKGLHIFSHDELEKATNNFDDSNELGDGGYGTVYYGKLQGGLSVAVKRLYEKSYKRGVEQFMNEAEILARLCHENLVTLYGCTSPESQDLLLVYEYVPNGTVAEHLHGEQAKPGALSWPMRLKIAIETASALVYLHASDIIHRDVKTSNLLLESNFCVKVADFGLSRLVPMDVTHVTTFPQGTPGYLDPEYHQSCHLTDKSDVYSFGVVLIELISSKPPIDMNREHEEVSLANMAINKILKQAVGELLDPNLGYESDQKVRKTINAVAELAFQCLQNRRESRPTMAEVLDVLKRIQRELKTKKRKENSASSSSGAILKSDHISHSPNSVSEKGASTSETPNVCS